MMKSLLPVALWRLLLKKIKLSIGNSLFMKNLENNLDKALDMFINAMRLFISTELKRKYGYN